MSDFFKLQEIDTKIHEFTSKISSINFNPTNLVEEYEKVKNDSDYNPQFNYPELTFNPEKAREFMHDIDQHESVLGDILEQKRRLTLDKIDMFANRGNNKFSIYSKKAYGMPAESTLKKASEFLNLDSDKEEKTISSAKALKILRAELVHRGFNYEFAEREMSATASIQASSRRLFLKKGFMLSPNYVKRLVIHEIGTHALRAENGRLQPFKIFMQGFPNYLLTEEGLAVWNEERFGLLLKENLKNYAARAVAVKMAQSSPFNEVFNYLKGLFGESWAFRLTARVKRGLIDTEKPGGATRDFTYLEGYLKVKKHFEDAENINAELKRFYVGKITLEHLDLISEIPGVLPPKYLPKNTSFKSLNSF